MSPIRSRFLSATAASQRDFVNRDSELALFRSQLASRSESAPAIINYFGVGGIGKSRLLSRIEEIVETEKLGLSARVDLQTPSMRRQDAAICCLRHLFQKHHRIDFSRFDIAYAVYWQRSNPHLPLSRANLPLVDESEILGNVVSAASDVPVFGVVVGIFQILDRARRGARRWHRVRQDPYLKELDNLDTEALLDSLTFFFASDLIAGLKESGAQGIILVDAHEALWEDVTTTGGHLQRDAWLRDLVCQCPGVVVVVNSRDELPWNALDDFWVGGANLISKRVGDLAQEHRTTFLKASGITDCAMIDEIGTASQGVPFYLDLAVDTVAALGLSQSGAPIEFATTTDQIVGRFISHVPRAEEELLKVLSVPRFWNRKLASTLVRHFNIGFPLSRWSAFCR